jgi:hypothetical protein
VVEEFQLPSGEYSQLSVLFPMDVTLPFNLSVRLEASHIVFTPLVASLKITTGAVGKEFTVIVSGFAVVEEQRALPALS